jgi:hypothetical protein
MSSAAMGRAETAQRFRWRQRDDGRDSLDSGSGVRPCPADHRVRPGVPPIQREAIGNLLDCPRSLPEQSHC